MQRFCTKCGKPLTNIDRFCPSCGAQSDDIEAASQQKSEYAGNAEQNRQYQQPYYAQPMTLPPKNNEMSLGSWIGTVIVTTFFGIVSLVFLFIWAFTDGPESRKNYCKAMLIVQGISLVLSIILLLVFFIPFFSIIKEGIVQGYNESKHERQPGDDYYYSEEYDNSDINKFFERYGIHSDGTNT